MQNAGLAVGVFVRYWRVLWRWFYWPDCRVWKRSML